MKLKLIITLYLFSLCIACSNKSVKIKNEKRDNHNAILKLELSKTKKFILDAETAPMPQYIQIYKDSSGIDNLTFLNVYNNSIYFYDYKTQEFKKRIVYEEIGANGIEGFLGFFISSNDSIYIYNKKKIELILANDKSEILNRISLRNNLKPGDSNFKYWGEIYPQYYPSTVTLFKKINGKIMLNGFSHKSLTEEKINTFRFIAQIDLRTNNVDFTHIYPEKLYGNGVNWEGSAFTEVYSDFNYNRNELVLSFPVSHNLYITDLESDDYKIVYGGSNKAGTIHSINKAIDKTSREDISLHYGKQDVYEGIIYDAHRKIYYRIMRKSIREASITTKIKEKDIIVIIMDEEFNYLGETTIGSGIEWYVKNAFITKEGLNIEYLNKNDKEENLIIKIFKVTKI